jgi:RecA-family ATPase
MPDRPTVEELRRRLEKLDQLEARAGGKWRVITEERARLRAELAEAEETPMTDPGYTVHEFRRRRPNGQAGEPKPTWRDQLHPITMADLAGKPVPTMSYLWGDWLPLGRPVLLAGAGGHGKTTLACQLAAARAIGQAFLGLPVEQGVSLALLCEEAPDDAHRMLACIAEHLGHGLGQFGGFHLLPRLGQDNVLVARTRRGQIEPTKFYRLMAEMIGDLRVTLQVLDNARHVCAVNEIDASEVTAAWALLHGLMRPTGGTTLLVGHVPKDGSSEFAGNAAWSNVARARLFLGLPPKERDDEQEDDPNDPRRILSRSKSNSAGLAKLELVWERGAFRLAHPDVATFGDRLDREMRRGQARQAFLDALDQLTAQRRNVSECAGKNYAPLLIKRAGLAEGFTKRELEAAMEGLFRDGVILARCALPWRTDSRKAAIGIARRDAS